MKRTCALLFAAICFLGMAGCGKPLQEAKNSETPVIQPTTAVTSAATAEPKPLATPKPADTPSPTATPKVTNVVTVAPPEGPAVIYDGDICGGYYNGKWLKSDEAALYLDVPATFYSYNLLGKGETVVSEGVSCSDPDDYGAVYYHLKIGDWSVSSINVDSYTGHPLESYYLYNIRPEYMPDIYEVEDMSVVKSAIQGMLDKKFGKDAPEAQIIIAVSADIDSDGKKETVVNAANDEENVYEYYCDKPLYCISCVIEDDGEIVVIDEYYMSPETAISIFEKNEDRSFEKGDDVAFYAGGDFFHVQNIIDLDHDGFCEFVLSWQAWENTATLVYDYEDKTMKEVICCGSGV